MGQKENASDYVGKKFNMLTVIRKAEDGQRNRTLVEVECKCGAKKVLLLTRVKRGIIKSCGCLSSSKTSERNFVHGLSKTPEYTAWKNMIGRCNNKNRKDWKWYGGRGIKVSEEFSQSFIVFLNHVGRRPSKEHTIEWH